MIFIGADHAGFKLKEEIKELFNSMNIEFEDLTPDFSEGDDYPDSALKVAEKVVESSSRGIILCGTGIGDSIAANKVPGIRAALCRQKEEAELSRAHNDSNILILSGWFEEKGKLQGIIEAWLNTEFEGGRHERRLTKIKEIEKKYSK
ncbi:MAG: ribose 5-phosphate isomerase B [archaeon]